MKLTIWKDVWGNRSLLDDHITEANLLDALIKLDGFDTGMGDYSVAQWWELTGNISERFDISPQDSLLEVGCGSGAFLYCVNQQTKCSITGVDYSKSLIDIARKYVLGKFEVSDAKALPFPNRCFDLVLSHSVFQYFPTEEYAHEVLREIYRVMKDGAKACIMDVNDRSCEKSYHDDRRQLYKDPKEYDAKYGELKHLFFDKEQLVSYLHELTFSNIQFFPHYIPGYVNSRFRFNMSFEKAG